MKCPTCKRESNIETMRKIYQPSNDPDDITERLVCHTCYCLTLIVDLLKEIKDGRS